MLSFTVGCETHEQDKLYINMNTYVYIRICVSNQSDGIRETLPGTLIFIQETQDSVCSDGPSQH